MALLFLLCFAWMLVAAVVVGLIVSGNLDLYDLWETIPAKVFTCIMAAFLIFNVTVIIGLAAKDYESTTRYDLIATGDGSYTTLTTGKYSTSMRVAYVDREGEIRHPVIDGSEDRTPLLEGETDPYMEVSYKTFLGFTYQKSICHINLK